MNRLLILLQKFAEIWCNARVLCPALVAAWVGGSLAVQPPPPRGGGTFLGPWVFPNSGLVGLEIHPPPPLPPVTKQIPGQGANRDRHAAGA